MSNTAQQVPAGLSRDTMPAVPAGKIWIAEYGTVRDDLVAERIYRDDGRRIKEWGCGPETTLYLEGWSRGFRIAGSCMVWREAEWSVTFTDQRNCRQGRRFSGPEAEKNAKKLFTEWSLAWMADLP